MDRLQDINDRLTVFMKSELDNIESILKNSKQVLEATQKINSSWSHSTLSTHAMLFYKDFEQPSLSNQFDIEWGLIHGIPSGWSEKTAEEVNSKITELSDLDISLDSFFDEAKALQEKTETFHEDIVSLIERLDISTQITTNVQNIKSFTTNIWSTGINKFIPTNLISRDSRAIYSGTRIPPHVSTMAFADHFLTLCNNVKKLISSIQRLLNQYGKQSQQSSAELSIKSNNLIDIDVIKNQLAELSESQKSLSEKVEKYLSRPLQRSIFISEKKISELENIQIHQHPKFDLQKLIQLCNEVNIAYKNECFFSCISALRIILDHIPPIFNGAKNFTEVANSWAGKSYRDTFKRLDDTLKDIANNHIHAQIRKTESLPSEQQISFMAEIESLLSEAIVALKKDI